MAKTLKDKIIQALIESKNIKKSDIDAAIGLQKRKKISLDKALIEKQLINEKELMLLLVKELHIPTINLSKYKIDPTLKEIIPEKVARQYRIIPISKLGHIVTVAVSDPFNIFAVDDLKNITGKEIDVVISTDSDIIQAINIYYGSRGSSSVTDISKDISVGDFEVLSGEDSAEISDEAVNESEQAPIIKMVNLIIKEALRQGASDIHIEPTPDNVRVRYRIDGVLRDVFNVPKENQNAMIVRIKIMSRLDITSNRVPQDGRFKLKTSTQMVDFRVSLLPIIFGQKVVMRVLDKKSLSIGLTGLGFSAKAVEQLQNAVTKPFGMILVTGPTGSGKSTTLYSIINQLNTIDKNIITVEDPVEYLIEGLTQIQARPEIGLTFAEGLRAILRQSPDIVMVGEIRDSETADIAIKASLTGQLVFSTLHTNDAAGALTRLVDMGVESFLVASSLVMVTAQRLCRRICINCKEKVKIPDEVFEGLGFSPKQTTVFYHGKGCEACRQTGYRGRMGVTEILDLDDPVREMLIKGASSDGIKKYAIKHQGMITLRDDMLAKFSAGETTLEEVLRVTTRD
jgi:type IV pilus assembly protein PilB